MSVTEEVLLRDIWEQNWLGVERAEVYRLLQAAIAAGAAKQIRRGVIRGETYAVMQRLRGETPPLPLVSAWSQEEIMLRQEIAELRKAVQALELRDREREAAFAAFCQEAGDYLEARFQRLERQSAWKQPFQAFVSRCRAQLQTWRQRPDAQEPLLFETQRANAYGLRRG